MHEGPGELIDSVGGGGRRRGSAVSLRRARVEERSAAVSGADRLPGRFRHYRRRPRQTATAVDDPHDADRREQRRDQGRHGLPQP